MRLFVAAETPGPQRDSLAAVCERGFKQGVRWVPADNVHLTVKFLGEVNEAMLPAVKDALAAAAAAAAPFELAFGGGGCFPNPREPRVVWLGVTTGEEEARTLAAAVEKAVVAAGFPSEEKAFRPHVTLGRVKDPRPGAAAVAAKVRALADFATPAAVITTLVLYRSVTLPDGARYDEVARFPLGGG